MFIFRFVYAIDECGDNWFIKIFLCVIYLYLS